jgi:transcriptional regulator with XRE-family HTH domain
MRLRQQGMAEHGVVIISSAALPAGGQRGNNERPVSRDIQGEERQQQFARNLRATRERARLTQAGVARVLGMTDEVYARYERSKMWPSIDRLCRLCVILECTADSLLGLDQGPSGPEEPPPPEDSQPVRRLMRQLRKSRPGTVRLVARMLAELDKHAAPDAPPGNGDGGDGDDEP